jgi:hypothetical protein
VCLTNLISVWRGAAVLREWFGSRIEHLVLYGLSEPAQPADYHMTTEAVVPSWRLAEEAQKRRALQAELQAAKQRIAELERIIKAGRLASIKRVG